MNFVFNWSLTNNNIFLIDRKGNKEYFCPGIRVAKKYRDVMTGKYYLKLKFVVGSYTESLTIPRQLLADGLLPALFEKGFSISPIKENHAMLSEILMDQEAVMDLSFCHTKLGFAEFKGKFYFFGKNEASGALKSRYVGHKNLSSEGSFDDWRSFVQEMLNKSPVLAIPLAMGLSAPVDTRMTMCGLTDLTLIWGIVGASSKGKTTSLELAASVWGLPSGKGIIDNITGTRTYSIASLASSEGFPNFYDETSAVSWDFTAYIYSAALSREGGRCNPDGTPKERKTWSGAIVFTGETSMFHQTNGNAGLHARLIEVDLDWFASAQDADTVKAFVSKNYGTAWVPFVNHLQSISDEDLKLRIDDSFEFLKKQVALYSRFTEDNWKNKYFSGLQIRIIKKLAILRVTIDLMCDAFDVKVNEETLLDALMTTYESNVGNSDKIADFYEDFKQFVVSHKYQFPDKNVASDEIVHRNPIGMYSITKDGLKCVWVTSNVFKEHLIKHGLDTSTSTLRALNHRNMIVRFKDRYQKLTYLGKVAVNCYCVILEIDPTSEPLTKPKKPKKER